MGFTRTIYLNCWINKSFWTSFYAWNTLLCFPFFLLSAFFALPLGGSESGRSTPSLSMYSDSKSSPSVYQQAPRHFHIPGRHSLLSFWSSIAGTCTLLNGCFFGCFLVFFCIDLWILNCKRRKCLISENLLPVKLCLRNKGVGALCAYV